MPIESLGGWHPEAAQQVKKIGAAKARQTGEEEDVAIAHLFQKLAVLLARGNAALLLNRIPSFPDPQEGSCKPNFFIPSIIPSFSKPPPNPLLSYSWTWSHPLSPSLSGNSQVLRVCIIVLCWNILYLFFKSSILPEAQGMFFFENCTCE